MFDTRMPVDLTPIATDPVFVASLIGYFLLGYLLYAVVLVGIGSFCNTVQEAQNLLTSALLMGAIVLAFAVAERVFRYGILSTGKPPKWREILRWFRGAPAGPRVADAPTTTTWRLTPGTC